MLMNDANVIKVIEQYRPISYFYLYPKVIYDRFGILYDNPHDTPVKTDMTLYEAADKRCKSLPDVKIMWSGGIDSTFIVCTYLKNKVPFTVVCDNRSVRDNPLFYEWLLKQKCNVFKFDDILDAYKLDKMFTGYTADLLFAPLEHCYDEYTVESDVVNKIAEGIKADISTETLKARLMDFSCMYNQQIAEMNYILFPTYFIDSFFNHKDFTDVAFSHFLERTFKDGKPEMKARILEVTEDENITKNTVRKGTRIIPRLMLNEKNFRNFIGENHGY